MDSWTHAGSVRPLQNNHMSTKQSRDNQSVPDRTLLLTEQTRLLPGEMNRTNKESQRFSAKQLVWLLRFTIQKKSGSRSTNPVSWPAILVYSE